MKVAIVGGTGMIGRALTANLEIDGHEVVVLSRDPSRKKSATPSRLRCRATESLPCRRGGCCAMREDKKAFSWTAFADAVGRSERYWRRRGPGAVQS